MHRQEEMGMRALSAKKTAPAGVIAIIAFVLAGCTAPPQPSVDGESTVTEIEAEFGVGTTTFTNGTLVSPHLSIHITDSAVIPAGEEGNEFGELPVLAIWYETTNRSDQQIDPLSAWFTHFRAIQDGGEGSAVMNELTLGMPPVQAFEATQSAVIDNGATVLNAVAYALPDGQVPVELIASDAVLNQIGSVTYPVN